MTEDANKNRKYKVDAIKNARASDPRSLIPRPDGERSKHWKLIVEMGLEHDKATYNAIMVSCLYQAPL